MENQYPKGTSYRRRQAIHFVAKIAIGITSITIIALSYLYIRSTYDLTSPNTSFMQYFCNNEPQSSNENIDLEHVKATHLKSNFIPENTIPDTVWNNLPVKGVYYMVVSNKKLQAAKSVIKSMEDNMSNGSRYPWILLNNQNFDEKFQKYVKRVTKAPVYFGKIDTAAWEYPSWIDVPRAEYFMMEQGLNQNVYKGESLSYHQLLRYHSGLIFHHPLFRKAQYAWRVEPGSEYNCNMDDDPFLVMKTNNKKLGYVLTGKEASNTMPTLMERVKEFMSFYPEYILHENKTIMPWIVTDTGEYNNCYMWSHFQIVDLSFFRTEAYQAFFDYLDNTGNFFYER
ncbi:glycosyltransferase family 15 protein [Backusella circina FSU 941]|nr:glycosyltransferase family 15 protein [Backusella circina FSU 941]